MASIAFTRTGTTTISYRISSAYYSSSYSYAVQVQSNSSGKWINKVYPRISSSGTASGTLSVTENSGYYCRLVEYYNDSVNAYVPSSKGKYVNAYETVSYSGYLSLYQSARYNYSTAEEYQGYVIVRATLSSGAGSGWYIRVNNSGTNTTYISTSGTYTIYLDYLYDGDTSTAYKIYLYDPDGTQQDYLNVWHEETPTLTHTLRFSSGLSGASNIPSTQSTTVPACWTSCTFVIPSTVPVCSGYEFRYWVDSSGYSHAPLTNINVSGTETLTGVWKETSSVVVPSVSLSVSNVSSGGFTVTATQSNLTKGTWAIEVSMYSSFTIVAGTSGESRYSTRTITASFSGLHANTMYYIRVYNTDGSSTLYKTGWSRTTGIATFAWTSNDSTYITSGNLISTYITASKWNSIQSKITAVSVRNGYGSVTINTVYTGDRITADVFNYVRNNIANLDGCGTVPSVKTKRDILYADDFANTTWSLKSAINRAISNLNS